MNKVKKDNHQNSTPCGLVNCLISLESDFNAFNALKA